MMKPKKALMTAAMMRKAEGEALNAATRSGLKDQARACQPRRGLPISRRGRRVG